MTIPADIEKKAAEIVGRMADHVWKGDAIADVASAIMEAKAEERERCALIADDHSMMAMARANRAAVRDKKIHENAIFVAGEIASAIRNEGEQG